MRRQSRWMVGSAMVALIASGVALVLSAFAASGGPGAVSSWPPDSKNYRRRVIREDRTYSKIHARQGSVRALSGTATSPGIFVIDPNSVNNNGYSEPSI